MAITPGGRVGDASSLAKPGYKGKRKLSDYEREVAHALMRKGHSKRDAIRMARGIIDKAAKRGKWGRGKKASAPVRAGAAASVAQRKSFSNDVGDVIDMAKVPAKKRSKMPKSNFAIPGKRKYLIHDKNHARLALAMVSKYGSPAEKAKVHAAVVAKYPELAKGKKGGDTLDHSDPASDFITVDLASKRRSKGRPGRHPKTGRWTKASDDAYDKTHGIEEGSPRDKALDKKRGVPEDDAPKMVSKAVAIKKARRHAKKALKRINQAKGK